MTTATMKRMIDSAKVRLPGALDSAINMELFTLLAEFFRSSNVWTEDLTADVVPTDENRITNPSAYTYLLVPSEGTILRLMSGINSQGTPVQATMPVPGEVILRTSPDIADTYTFRVSLSILDPTTSDGYPQFPDWILTKYWDGLLDGLLGRMMSQIGKPYSSPTTAVMHLRRFRSTISRAKVEASHKNLYGAQSWQFPQSFANRR